MTGLRCNHGVLVAPQNDLASETPGLLRANRPDLCRRDQSLIDVFGRPGHVKRR